MAKQQQTKKGHVLPAGVLASDLEMPDWKARDRDEGKRIDYDASFDLWYVASFGWVIPTLSIAKGGQRTYAVAIGEGGLRPATRGATCRVGMGPHVLEQVHVYAKKARVAVLQPFNELRTQGQANAGTTRDRISSRRAQGALMRAEGRRSWRWDV